MNVYACAASVAYTDAMPLKERLKAAAQEKGRQIDSNVACLESETSAATALD